MGKYGIKENIVLFSVLRPIDVKEELSGFICTSKMCNVRV